MLKEATIRRSINKKLLCFCKVNSWYLNPSHFSNWLPLIRLVATIEVQERRSYGGLTVEDIKDAETHIIREVQQDASQVKSDSNLIALQPHIGGDEFLQCNERLRYTDFLPYDTQYTIPLPRKNWITKLMLKFYHENDYHARGIRFAELCIAIRAYFKEIFLDLTML